MKNKQRTHEVIVPRRAALKGLGALVISAPSLAASSCSDDGYVVDEHSAGAAAPAAEGGPLTATKVAP